MNFWEHWPRPVAIGGLGTAAGGAGPEGALPKRALGKTGVEVTCLALGGVVGMQRPPAEFDSEALANAALDLGINYFDTSDDYNKGQSETNYGRVLAKRRQEVFLATKTGARDYDGAMRAVEASLKRLQTDRLDLFQIHGLRVNEDLERIGKKDGVYAALLKLREQKVTRFIGVTGHESGEIMARAIEMFEFDTVPDDLQSHGPSAARSSRRCCHWPCNRRWGIQCMKVMGRRQRRADLR